MTPSRSRSSSWTPQKQPAAKIAVSVFSLIAVSLLGRGVCSTVCEARDPLVAAAAEELEREEEYVEDVEEDADGDDDGAVGARSAQSVEVIDRDPAEDGESGNGVDDLAVGDRDEDRDDPERDQAQQRPEQTTGPAGEISSRGVAIGAAGSDERRRAARGLPQSGRVGVAVVGEERGDRQA